MFCMFHNDLDGKCAAHWVYRSVGIHDREYVEWTPDRFGIAMNYNMSVPFEKIQPNEQVYIVDFSLSLDDMRKLLSITKDVTWIDHHKTAIEKYKDFEYDIRGLRYDGYAGCELTYAYIHKMTQRGSGEIKPFEPSMLDDCPYFTKLIGDWDLWKFKYGDNTRYFKSALESYNCDPDSDIWFDVQDNEEKYFEEGKVIERYKKEYWKECVKEISFETDFEGYKCIASNGIFVGLDYFNSIDKDYDIVLPFYFSGDNYTVSLYTKKDIDVSVIAKKYNGGGHKKAAGFVCKNLPFYKI